MLRTTGSKAHRAWKCPASLVLAPITEEVSSDDAKRGTAIHAFLERVRVIGLEAAILEAPLELRPFLLAIDFESLPTHLATEVAFLWDYKARTAREIGRNIGRDYDGHLARTLQEPRRDTEIPLTIDLVGVDTANGIGYVGDYKTGRTRYPPPDQFAQTLIAALCVREVYGVATVRLEVIYIGYDADDFRERAVVDAWGLDDFADELERALDLAEVYELEHKAGRPIPLNVGDHCDHCDAFKHCEAQTGLVRKLPATVDALLASGYLTRDRLVDAWHQCERLKQLITAIQSEICMASTREPGGLDLGDGTVLGPVEDRREKLVGAIAANVVERHYGKAARDEAVTITMSKEKLREVVAKNRKEGEKISTKKGDGVLDKIEAEIKRAGGVDVTITSRISVRKAKKQLPLPTK